jgi:hypothetical protein
MPFTISPGVVTKEIDLTTVVPEISMTEGAIAGPFRWGPSYWSTTVSNESELSSIFGKPDAATYKSFFTAASYLAYSGSLKVVRTPNTTDAKNATMDSSNTVYISNDEVYENTYDPQMGGTQNDDYGPFVAKYAGDLGNSLRVSLCGASKANTNSDGTLNSNTDVALTGTMTWTETSGALAAVSASTLFTTELSVGDVITLGTHKLVIASIASAAAAVARSSHGSNITAGAAVRHKRSGFSEPSSQMVGTCAASANGVTVTGTSTLFDLQVNVGDLVKLVGTNEERRVSAIASNTSLTVSQPFVAAAAANTWSRKWEYADSFDGDPTTSAHCARNSGAQDEVHIAIIDEDGEFTGANNTVVETYTGSVAGGAKGEDGQSIYYKDLVNKKSAYVRWMDHDASGDADSALATTAWGGAASGTFNGKGIIISGSMTGGAAGSTATAGNVQTGFDEFKNAEKIDVTLLMTGDATAATQIHCINNIAEYRKDCVAFVSPLQANVVDNAGSETDDVVDHRNSMPSSSYAVMDSGWKYMYDKYNDVYRYVPLNGDIAGCCAFTDSSRDPFWSPAGIERGNIRNAIKLPFNPNKTQRDELYKNGVNPVTAMPGSGILLFGDKTLLAKPSAFDRINVRRLFILLEKSIARMAESFLFEFNDSFTRSRFTSTVEPFLRDIQGRGGVQDFAVVCDDSNNPPDVVDRNEFRGDIYVKPSRSINFIQLQFVAVRSGVEFSEIIGAR